jgi:hypothetical protein
MKHETNPSIRFVPTAGARNNHTWWQMSPRYFEQLLTIIGFKVDALYRFEATHMGAKPYQLYSLVAHR